jgi:hypothetical protein
MNKTNYKQLDKFNSWIFSISIACMATIFLSSCLPLTQTYGDWTDQGVKVLGEGEYVNLWIDHKNYPSVPVILSEISYAQNEFGEKYPIIVNPEEKVGYSNKNRIYLFLKGSNNFISKYKSWDDGFWTIYLKLQCDKEIYDKVVSFELDTFYYNPIFNGVPN